MALRRNRENAFMCLIVPSHPLDPERLLLRRRDGPARAGLRSFLTSGGRGLVGGKRGEDAKIDQDDALARERGDRRARKSRRPRPRCRALTENLRGAENTTNARVTEGQLCLGGRPRSL